MVGVAGRQKTKTEKENRQMNEMTMDRIRDEMARANNPAMEEIGEYVTRRVAQGAEVPEGKTLAGAYKEMEDWARKHQLGGCCCVAPHQAYELIDKYFGFAGPQDKPVVAPTRPSVMDDLDLDALLGV